MESFWRTARKFLHGCLFKKCDGRALMASVCVMQLCRVPPKGALRQHAWPKVPLFHACENLSFPWCHWSHNIRCIIHGYVRSSIQLMLREWPENTKPVVPSCDILQREHCIYAPHVLKKHMFCEYNRVEYGSAAQQRRRQKYFRWKRIQRKEKSADWEEEQASSKACELWGP